jgi:hypothetical protein
MRFFAVAVAIFFRSSNRADWHGEGSQVNYPRPPAGKLHLEGAHNSAATGSLVVGGEAQLFTAPRMHASIRSPAGGGSARIRAVASVPN